MTKQEPRQSSVTKENSTQTISEQSTDCIELLAQPKHVIIRYF